MEIDMTQVLLALISLLSVVITTFVVPWIKSKTTLTQQEQLVVWVKIAVAAAEQLFALAEGEQKKDYVVNWLKERGITFDEAVIDAAVEAEVYKLKN
jgi:hypothetical protein